MSIQDLQDRLVELHDQSSAILAKAEEEKRDLTDEEKQELDEIIPAFDAVKEDIARMEAIETQRTMLSEGGGRKTPPEPPRMQGGDEDDPDPNDPPPSEPAPRLAGNRNGDIRVRQPQNRFMEYGKGGFRSFGEFAMSVKNACMSGGSLDPRLARMQPSTFGNEGTGADGGFVVPPDFRQSIVSRIFGEQSLLSRTDQLTTGTNSVTIPIDETTPWQDSGGIQAYWDGEGHQLTQSKPALKQETLKLNKLTSLVPVTDELLDDAPALDTYLRRKAPEKMDFRINRAIVAGTGAGQPLGILESPATVSVAAEGSQAADTIVYENISKMYNRMYGPYRQDAVWLINQSIEPQLDRLFFKAESGDTSGVPVYLPAGGLSSSPFAMLKGKPVIPTQACNVLGDKGDIIFASMREYLTVTKTGGIRSDVSMHLYFDYNMTAFRFIFRVAGQPWLTAAIDDRAGSNTYGAFVTLDERAP